ncbi:MAG: hypothetical protein ABIP96_05750 [Patescibacteria group bacterium]
MSVAIDTWHLRAHRLSAPRRRKRLGYSTWSPVLSLKYFEDAKAILGPRITELRARITKEPKSWDLHTLEDAERELAEISVPRAERRERKRKERIEEIETRIATSPNEIEDLQRYKASPETVRRHHALIASYAKELAKLRAPVPTRSELREIARDERIAELERRIANSPNEVEDLQRYGASAEKLKRHQEVIKSYEEELAALRDTRNRSAR